MRLNRFLNILIDLYVGLVGILCLLVLGYSLVTRVVWRQQVENDLFDVVSENIPLLVVCVIVVLAALYLIWQHALQVDAATAVNRKAMAASTRGAYGLYVALAFALLVSLFCVLSVRGVAVNDGGTLDTCINQFMEGNFNTLYQGYLAQYPFQIGYVMIGQLIALLFGQSNFLVYQFLNIGSILVTVYCLYGMTYEMSERQDYADLAALLSLGALCLYAYATLVYNDIWSLAPQMGAIYLTMRYIRTGRRQAMIGGMLALAFACVIKSNCYIALIAIVLALVLAGIRETGWKACGCKVGWGLLTVVVTLGAVQVVNACYAKATYLDTMPDGVPSTAYFAMGMHQVDDEGCIKNGWYDGTGIGFLIAADNDSALASQMAKADMQESLAQFRESPKYFVKFYANKFLQQWGDGTCSSLRQMEMSGRNVEPRSAAAQSLMYGTLRDVLSWGMNVFHTVYYLGAVLYFGSVFVRLRHKKSITTNEAFLVMFILGGMLFHELWEASSRYVIRYYLCMIPLAAIGYGRIFDQNK